MTYMFGDVLDNQTKKWLLLTVSMTWVKIPYEPAIKNTYKTYIDYGSVLLFLWRIIILIALIELRRPTLMEDGDLAGLVSCTKK